MSPLDAMFLDAEDGDPHASMAIASVAVVDGSPPGYEAVVRTIAGRLPLVPRYRQKPLRVPFDLSQPVWVDDANFDISYHLRVTALPAPSDEAALCRLVARIMSARLDRERPLWEYWVIEGLPGGRWALLSKVHHCLVDGVGGNQLYRLLFDDSPTPGPAMPDTWQPQPLPSALELTVDAMGDLARARLRGLEQLSRAMRTPAALNQHVTETTRGLATLAGALVPGARSSLTGPIGASRRYGLARVRLADIVTVAKAFEVTVNDVVMAAVTGAFRDLLLRRGEEPGPDGIRAMVPVSVRAENAMSVVDNRVSMMLPVLPVELADPVERLKVVHSRLVALKASKEAEASNTVNALAQYEPFSLLSALMRLAARLPRRNVVTVTTNVPGPREQLYILGQPIVEILPYVPISGQIRVGVSVMTYRGQAAFGVTGDYGSAPEVDDFAACLAGGIADLLAATPQRPPSIMSVPRPRTGKTVVGTATKARSMKSTETTPAKAAKTPTKAAPRAAPGGVARGARSGTGPA